MKTETSPKIKCSEIRDILQAQDSNEIYFYAKNWVITLLPFWKKAIQQIANNTGYFEHNLDKYLNVANHAFELMDGWRLGSTKLVKARRNEIDSTISYIRNGALLPNVSDLVFSPICRNATSALRACLNLSTNSYSNEQLPGVVAQQIYSIALVKSLFPVDDSDLTSYLPAKVTIHGSNDPKDLDNYHLMFQIAAEKLNLVQEVKAMNLEANNIWENFKQPEEWKIPEMIWTEKTDSLSTKLYYSNMAAFHASK